MQQRLGLDVTVVECRWGDGAYEDKLAELLAADKDKKIKAVCVVHNETATGVTSDLPEVRKTMDKANHPAMLMVDGVSSIGALPFKFDEWGVDLAVTGSQKALSLPTGLGFVCASPKALAMQETAQLKRVYFDFKCVRCLSAASALHQDAYSVAVWCLEPSGASFLSVDGGQRLHRFNSRCLLQCTGFIYTIWGNTISFLVVTSLSAGIHRQPAWSVYSAQNRSMVAVSSLMR